MAFSRNFTFSKAWVGIQILLHTTKIAEMNDSDIDLSEKSEIFKIASVEKKLQLPEVGEKSGKIRDFPEIGHRFRGFGPKTVQT